MGELLHWCRPANGWSRLLLQPGKRHGQCNPAAKGFESACADTVIETLAVEGPAVRHPYRKAPLCAGAQIIGARGETRGDIDDLRFFEVPDALDAQMRRDYRAAGALDTWS